MPRFEPRKLIAQGWKFEGTKASCERIRSVAHAPKGLLWYSGGSIVLNGAHGLQRIVAGEWVMHFDNEWFRLTQSEVDRRWLLTEE
jgi:hypothetical protein